MSATKIKVLLKSFCELSTSTYKRPSTSFNDTVCCVKSRGSGYGKKLPPNPPAKTNEKFGNQQSSRKSSNPVNPDSDNDAFAAAPKSMLGSGIAEENNLILAGTWR